MAKGARSLVDAGRSLSNAVTPNTGQVPCFDGWLAIFEANDQRVPSVFLAKERFIEPPIAIEVTGGAQILIYREHVLVRLYVAGGSFRHSTCGVFGACVNQRDAQG